MTPERAAAFARALALVRPVSRRRLYWTARSVFVSDQAHVEAFDRVFFAVFGEAGAERTPRRRTSVRRRGWRAPSAPRPDPGPRARTARSSRSRSRRPATTERLATKRFDALDAARARAALPADVAARARHAAAAHAPPRARAPRPPDRPAAEPARQPAHRRRADPPRAPAPAQRAAAARDAVRHLGLDGALRARLPAVPRLRRRQRAERRGVRVRHAADAPDPRAAPAATPSARSSAPPRRRRTGRAGRASAMR